MNSRSFTCAFCAIILVSMWGSLTFFFFWMTSAGKQLSISSLNVAMTKSYISVSACFCLSVGYTIYDDCEQLRTENGNTSFSMRGILSFLKSGIGSLMQDVSTCTSFFLSFRYTISFSVQSGRSGDRECCTNYRWVLSRPTRKGIGASTISMRLLGKIAIYT